MTTPFIITDNPTHAPQPIGSDRSYDLGPLRDGAGNVPPFDGSEDLPWDIWKATGGPSVASGVATWIDATAGTVRLSISATDTANLAAGRYRIRLSAVNGAQILGTLPADSYIEFEDAPVPLPSSGALTRAVLESILIRRCGRRMAFAKLDGITQNGTNLDLNDPIREGLDSIGVTAANAINVADSDLATISGKRLSQILDVAELRVLESILGNWDEFDQARGIDRQDLGKMGEAIRTRVNDLQARLMKLYGVGLGSLRGGGITLRQAVSSDESSGVG
jgi:hypothetical protein